MSLFPAYSASSPTKEEEQHDQEDKSWLENRSFPAAKTDNLSGEGYVQSETALQEAILPSVSTSSTDHIPPQSPHVSSDDRTSDRRHRKRKRRRSRSRSSSPSRSRNKHKRNKHRQKKHKHRDRSPPRPAAVTVESTTPLRGIFLEDAGVRPEVAFSVDRRADRAARAFPEMYHHHVARYIRVRGVLGRPRRTERRLISSRFFDRHWRRRLRRTPIDVTAISPLPIHHSYVPLTAPSSDPHPSESPADPGDYLRGLSSDIAFEFRRETAELNRRLADSPRDVSLWLELVEFQQRRLGGRVTAQQLLERQLAVLERALKECPGSAELRLRRLELRQHEQPTEEARKEWGLLLFGHPADLGVWRR